MRRTKTECPAESPYVTTTTPWTGTVVTTKTVPPSGTMPGTVIVCTPATSISSRSDSGPGSVSDYGSVTGSVTTSSASTKSSGSSSGTKNTAATTTYGSGSYSAGGGSPSTNTATAGGTKTDSQTGTVTGTETGGQTGTITDSKTGAATGSYTTMGSNTATGTAAVSITSTGLATGMETGSQTGSETSSHTGTATTSANSTVNGTTTGTQTGTQAGTSSGTETGTKTGCQVSTSTGTHTVTKAGHATATPPIRIMPLGDGITLGLGSDGDGGYREPLLPLLHQSGYDITFVGRLKNGDNAVDPNHEGLGNVLIKELVYEIQTSGTMRRSAPDYVLLHVGLKEMESNVSVPEALEDLMLLVNFVQSQAPKATILLASHIPSSNSIVNTRIQVYNKELETAVKDLAHQGAPVSYVDMSKTITPTVGVDLFNDFYPNDSGYRKMAQVWLDALKKVLPTPGAKIVISNPHFKTLTDVPVVGASSYCPTWKNKGLVSVAAEASTDLNAVAPFAGFPGMNSTFTVIPCMPVTVVYRVRDSISMPYCSENRRSQELKLASNTDLQGKEVTVVPGDNTWKSFTYTFTPSSSSVILTLSAPGPVFYGCGPMVADIVARQG